jgi:hypothetical protein
MTPKEKAEKLCYLYQGDFEKDTLNMSWTMAKKCALIAVDEISKNLEYLCMSHLGTYKNPKIQYFKEVKQEIEKL